MIFAVYLPLFKKLPENEKNSKVNQDLKSDNLAGLQPEMSGPCIKTVNDGTIRSHLHQLVKLFNLSKLVPYELSETKKLQMLSYPNLRPFLNM